MFRKADRLNAGSSRLARTSLVAALVTLMLCAAVSAQTLRPETDPRNLSLVIGKGGTVGTSCIKFDEYGDVEFEDEISRLDNFAIQLQQNPRTQGYYVIFGSCVSEADQRLRRAVDYLINTRGIDRGRITVVNGGCREQLTIELWICPSSTIAPVPKDTATVNPCPPCKAKSKPRRRVRRRGRRLNSG